jgi:hypothetical protein
VPTNQEAKPVPNSPILNQPLVNESRPDNSKTAAPATPFKKTAPITAATEQKISPVAAKLGTDSTTVSLTGSSTLTIKSGLAGNQPHPDAANRASKPQAAPVPTFTCDICDITLPKDQYDMHLVGKKHLKKIRSMSNVAMASGLTDKEKEEGQF